jgi:hypothetical protein
MQELTDLRDYFRSSSEDLIRLSTFDKASPALLLLNWNIYKWRTTSRVWYLEFHRQGVFIGVQGGVTNLIKSVTRQVLASRSSHMARCPPSLASTDFQLWSPCYRLLESMPMKPTRERLQIGASQPPPGPIGQLPLHIASSCQVHSRGDTYFGGIPIFLVIF